MGEKEWERPPHRLIAFEEIRELVRSSCGSVPVAAEIISAGKANTNFKLTFASEPPARLRFYDRDSTACPREAALAELVKSKVPVPILLGAGPDWSIWEWVEGRALEDAEEELPKVAEELGSVLARIGAFEFEAAGFLGPNLEVESFGEACDAYVGRMRECLGRSLVRERIGENLSGLAERFIETHQTLLDPYRGASRLVHSDYKASNVLIRDGHIAAVLDWEFAHSGSPLLDISILFRHREMMPPEVLTAFESGFKAWGGFLANCWREASRYLDLVSLLDFLSRASLGPLATQDVVRLIRNLTFSS